MLSQNFEHGKVIKNENKNISRKNKKSTNLQNETD